MFAFLIRSLMSLLLFATFANAKEIKNRDPKDFIRILEKFLSDGDCREINKQLEDFIDIPTGITVPQAKNREIYKDIMKSLGKNILESAEAFENGLPSLSELPNRHRLAPFFASIIPYGYLNPSMQDDFLNFAKKIPANWMQVASECDAIVFIQNVRACRDETHEMLKEYEIADEQESIIMLGELISYRPEIINDVRPENLQASTLASLLASAFGNSWRLEFKYPLMQTLAHWEKVHPGLTKSVSPLTSQPQNIPWCNLIQKFHSGNIKEVLSDWTALDTIYSTASKNDQIQVSNEEYDLREREYFLWKLLLSEESYKIDNYQLAKNLPDRILVLIISHIVSSDQMEIPQLVRCARMVSELASRDTVTKEVVNRIQLTDEVVERASAHLEKVHSKYVARDLRDSWKKLTAIK